MDKSDKKYKVETIQKDKDGNRAEWCYQQGALVGAEWFTAKGNWTGTPTLSDIVQDAVSKFTGSKDNHKITEQTNAKGVGYSIGLDHQWRVTCAVVKGECGNPVLVAHVFDSNHNSGAAQTKQYTCVIGARNTDDHGQKINPPQYKIQEAK